jgi:hypothetical protein
MDVYCGGILEFGHDQLVQCLKEHEAQLPADCKVLLEYKKSAKPIEKTTSGTSHNSSH